jgi:hypothetical protein
VTADSRASEIAWGRRAVLLIAALTAARLVLNAVVGLGDSEAYYWAWSEHLSLSYFDHPPATAWIIAATTAVFGNNSFAVRLGPTLLFAAAAYFLFRLANRLYGPRAAFLSVAFLVITPAFGLGGGTAVPDVPLGALWCAGLFVASRIADGGTARLWALAGLVVGVGFLAKYVALLLLFPLAYLALRDRARAFKSPWIYVGAALALAAALPVVLWNLETNWATLQYHAGRHLHAGPSFANLAQLIGGQLLYVSPVLLAFSFAVLPGLTRDAWRFGAVPARVFWLASVPPLIILSGFVVWTKKAEPHWPAFAYLPLYIEVARRYDDWRTRFDSRRWFRVLRRLLWGFPITLIVIAHLHLVTPLIVMLLPDKVYEAKWDLANETRDWDKAAQHALDIVATKAPRAFVTSYHYTLCGQLEFALNRRAPFACLSERADAFSYWTRDQSWLGSTALFVNDWRYQRPVDDLLKCDRVEPLPALETMRGGKKAREFRFALCVGFRGRVNPVPPLGRHGKR